MQGQGDGVCFRCLHPTKTHLLHSDMDWGRSIHVPAQFFQSWEEAQPKNLHVVILQFYNFAIFAAMLSKSVKEDHDLVQMELLHLART